ncbi:serine/threonine protein kinase [Streptomyces sp. NP160]|nr:serine/threonine protein kinase [Streptomyces sp. NP160]
MGEVHRAVDTVRGRQVALKVLADGIGADHDFTARFRREQHVAAQLNEPHIIPIHDFGEVDGRLFIDMRLVEGRDLAHVLDDGPLPPERAVHVADQAAQALDAAHAARLVHRDIKPSNLLVTPQGFVYVVDFGIARSTTATATSLTATGATLGTLAYMAPERFTAAPLEPSSDVYSLACVLYECLTGARPFTGDDLPSLLYAHFHVRPVPPSQRVPGLPPALDAVVLRGMAKDPAARFATCGEMTAAAHAALGGRAQHAPGWAPPPPPSDPAMTTTTRAATGSQHDEPTDAPTWAPGPPPAAAAAAAAETAAAPTWTPAASGTQQAQETELRGGHGQAFRQPTQQPTQPATAPAWQGSAAPGRPAGRRRRRAPLALVGGAALVVLAAVGVAMLLGLGPFDRDARQTAAGTSSEPGSDAGALPSGATAGAGEAAAGGAPSSSSSADAGGASTGGAGRATGGSDAGVHPDAVAATYPSGYAADGSLDHGEQAVWWASQERFREVDGDGCNPYTFIYGGVETDPACPVGQVKSDWNVDFVKDAWVNGGCLPDAVRDDDLTTFREEGDYTPYAPGAAVTPGPGDAVLWTDPSGRTGAVGLVLEAASPSKVKVVVGDDDDALVTRWVDPAVSTQRGEPVTGYVRLACG